MQIKTESINNYYYGYQQCAYFTCSGCSRRRGRRLHKRLIRFIGNGSSSLPVLGVINHASLLQVPPAGRAVAELAFIKATWSEFPRCRDLLYKEEEEEERGELMNQLHYFHNRSSLDCGQGNLFREMRRSPDKNKSSGTLFLGSFIHSSLRLFYLPRFGCKSLVKCTAIRLPRESERWKSH